MTKESGVKIGIASEHQVNEEFIQAWHRARQGTPTSVEERICFLDSETFLQVLSRSRLDILHALRVKGSTSVRALSEALDKHYRNVYQDARFLKRTGLIQETAADCVFVPWDKIRAEIDLLCDLPADGRKGEVA